MKTLNRITLSFLSAILFAFSANAQTALPSTTLSSAITDTTQCIPLASNTKVTVQNGLYVDLEYMRVLATPASGACTPVRRGDVSPQGVPTRHASGATVYIEDFGGTPGSTGFEFNTSFKPYGPAIRASINVLPIINATLGTIWDCPLTTSAVSPNTCVWKLISSPVTNIAGADCAATAACPSTAKQMHTVIGRGTLVTGSPSTYAVTTMSPAFSATTSYTCVAQDTTTIATNIGVLTAGYVSGTAVTFTGPNTTTDTFRFTCTGW